MNKYSKMNEGDNTCQSVWSMVQAILRGKIIALILSFEKLENSQIKTFQFQKNKLSLNSIEKDIFKNKIWVKKLVKHKLEDNT